VGRIYEEVKQRPNYLISQREGHGLAKTPAAERVQLPEREASLL
jgi:hypothetical protein